MCGRGELEAAGENRNGGEEAGQDRGEDRAGPGEIGQGGGERGMGPGMTLGKST